MKIKSLYIKRYKILENLFLDFDDATNVNVIIGKNGAGKTTLFEAIIHIFRAPTVVNNVNYLRKHYKELGLEFKIEYANKNQDVVYSFLDNDISWIASGESILNDENLFSFHELTDAVPYEQKGIAKYIPDHIVTYYSGESTRVTSLFEIHVSEAASRLQKGQNLPLREFINIDTRSIRKVLISLLPYADFKSKNSLSKDLSLDQIEKIQINFKQPKWYKTAKTNFEKQSEINSEVALEQFNPEFFYAEGEVGGFLDRLTKFSQKSYDNETEHILSLTINPNDAREYFSFEKIKGLDNSLDFFKMLDHTDHSDLIHSIKLDIKLKDSGSITEFSNMSEGEHQIKLILGLSEIFKGKETLFLFDEPDTFLHPEWQILLMEKLIAIKDSHVFVSTHSTTALTSIHSDNIIRMDNGKSVPIQGFKTYAADPNMILDDIQLTKSPVLLKLKPITDEISRLITSNKLEEAIAKLNKLEEDNNIDSTFNLFSDLRLAIKRKKIFR
jgi:predicted ATP-dependent endonuclease of OLD family